MAMERASVAVTTALLLAVLVATFAPSPALAACTGLSHNGSYGHKRPKDRLLSMLHPIKEGKWLRKVSLDVDSGPLNGVIHYIEVLDQDRNGNGGCAYLRGGGVGSDNAAFHIKSQRNYGLDFIIRAWGGA